MTARVADLEERAKNAEHNFGVEHERAEAAEAELARLRRPELIAPWVFKVKGMKMADAVAHTKRVLGCK